MAGAGINIHTEGATVIAALQNLTRRASNLSPLMRSIGEEVTIQTKSRIEEGGPIPWGNIPPPPCPGLSTPADRAAVFDLIRDYIVRPTVWF